MAVSLKRRQQVVAVIGAGNDAPAAVCKLAFAVGREIARRGAVLLNGGRTGVMESSAAGARKEGGIRSEYCRVMIAAPRTGTSNS